MRFLRWLGIGVLVLLALLVLVAVGARFSDGPIGPFPGGPLETGLLVSGPTVDWSFASDVAEVDFQLLEPPRSRRSWIIVHEGVAYIPCAMVRLWKQWPYEAEENGAGIVRVEGKRYRVQVDRIVDPALHAELSGLLAEKYGLTPGGTPGMDDLWIFRLDPRSG